MASNGIRADEGNCDFNTDLARGKIAVTVRAPLTIDKRTVEISIPELLEIAAQITIEWFAYSREMHARLAREMAAKKNEA